MADSATAPNKPIALSKRKVHRSPNYPSLSLSEAILRAKQIYDAEKRALAGSDTLLAHMGYKPRVGPGIRALSALKQYGLLEERSGQYRVSDAAFNILNLSDSSPDRLGALHESALKPALFNQVRTDFGDQLPSDINLRDYLIREHNFNPASVATFIKAFRETMELAKPPITDVSGGGGADDTNRENAESSDPIQHPRSIAGSFSANTPTVLPSRTLKAMQTIFAIRMKDGTNVELRADAPLFQKPHGGDLKALLDMLLPEEISRTPGVVPNPPAEPPRIMPAAEEKAVELPVKEIGKVASVGFMITNAQKAQLRERGHTDEQIAKMRPDEAHKILGLKN